MPYSIKKAGSLKETQPFLLNMCKLSCFPLIHNLLLKANEAIMSIHYPILEPYASDDF